MNMAEDTFPTFPCYSVVDIAQFVMKNPFLRSACVFKNTGSGLTEFAELNCSKTFIEFLCRNNDVEFPFFVNFYVDGVSVH